MKMNQLRILGKGLLDGLGRRSLHRPVRQSLALLRAVLREIFDEAAYERFLTQHELTSSVAAYSSFCQERDHTRARRPRCC